MAFCNISIQFAHIASCRGYSRGHSTSQGAVTKPSCGTNLLHKIAAVDSWEGNQKQPPSRFPQAYFPPKVWNHLSLLGGFLPQLKTYPEHTFHHLEVIPKNQLLVICGYPRTEAESLGSHLKFHHRNILCLKKIADINFFDNTHS